MAILESIDSNKPFFIEPAQHDLDKQNSTLCMASVPTIELQGQDAQTFYNWVKDHWRETFERDLQGLATCTVNGPLLTTWLPLVTFRHEICCYGQPRENPVYAELMDRLWKLTREWRDAGVDLVYLSGCNIKKD